MVGDITQWYSICPTCMKPQDPSPVLRKKKWCRFLFYFGNVPDFSKQIIHKKPHSQMWSLIEDT